MLRPGPAARRAQRSIMATPPSADSATPGDGREQPSAALSGDVVFLHGLRVDAVIGAFAWERRIRQTLILDIDMHTDVAAAAAEDDLAQALDYKRVSKQVQTFVSENRFQLVETLAERLAALLLEQFGPRWVRIRINKRGAVSGALDTGVVILRRAGG